MNGITITKRELHDWIQKWNPDFEDATLFNSDDEIEVADSTQYRIEQFRIGSYLSIDDPQGHEIYYAE